MHMHMQQRGGHACLLRACMRDAAAAAVRKPLDTAVMHGCDTARPAALQSAVQYLHTCMPWVCVRILHRLLLPQFYVTVASDLTGPAGAARKVRFRVFIYRSSRNWFFSHVFVREIETSEANSLPL